MGINGPQKKLQKEALISMRTLNVEGKRVAKREGYVSDWFEGEACGRRLTCRRAVNSEYLLVDSETHGIYYTVLIYPNMMVGCVCTNGSWSACIAMTWMSKFWSMI